MFISVSILDLFCLLPYLLGGATETRAAGTVCAQYAFTKFVVAPIVALFVWEAQVPKGCDW